MLTKFWCEVRDLLKFSLLKKKMIFATIEEMAKVPFLIVLVNLHKHTPLHLLVCNNKNIFGRYKSLNPNSLFKSEFRKDNCRSINIISET